MEQNSKHNLWMVIAIWLGLLVALIVASSHAATVSFGGAMSSLMQLSMIDSFVPTMGAFGFEMVLGLIVPIITIGSLYNTWMKFMSFTNELIIMFAKSKDDTTINVFDELLTFDSFYKDRDDKSENEPVAGDADGSLIADVLRALSITWVLILISGPLMLAISNALN